MLQGLGLQTTCCRVSDPDEPYAACCEMDPKAQQWYENTIMMQMERSALPQALLQTGKYNSTAVEVEAEGVTENRLQNLAITLNKLRFFLRNQPKEMAMVLLCILHISHQDWKILVMLTSVRRHDVKKRRNRHYRNMLISAFIAL